MANIIMCDPKGGSSTELTGSWGQVYVEKVTAGTNSVTNMEAASNYVSRLRANTTGTVLSVWRINAESPPPSENEYGGKIMGGNSGIRFRNYVWQYNAGLSSNYDAVIRSGSTFYVVSGVRNNL